MSRDVASRVAIVLCSALVFTLLEVLLGDRVRLLAVSLFASGVSAQDLMPIIYPSVAVAMWVLVASKVAFLWLRIPTPENARIVITILLALVATALSFLAMMDINRFRAAIVATRAAMLPFALLGAHYVGARLVRWYKEEREH